MANTPNIKVNKLGADEVVVLISILFYIPFVNINCGGTCQGNLTLPKLEDMAAENITAKKQNQLTQWVRSWLQK